MVRIRGKSLMWRGSWGCVNGVRATQLSKVPVVTANVVRIIIGVVNRGSSSWDRLKQLCWWEVQSAIIMRRRE